MPPTRRPGAAQAAYEADTTLRPPPSAGSSPAARAALLESPTGYHVAFSEARTPKPLDDITAYAAKQLRR